MLYPATNSGSPITAFSIAILTQACLSFVLILGSCGNQVSGRFLRLEEMGRDLKAETVFQNPFTDGIWKGLALSQDCHMKISEF